MARSSFARKEKKTFSLSRDVVAYLENKGKQERRPISEILEELIQERKLAAEQERIAQNVRAYYDSLTIEEQNENRVWGEFAESQFSGE